MGTMDDETEPDALERRPEARSLKVDDLMAELRRGRIRIPPFQRGLRWQRDDAAKLIDSLYRGYPVGTLLFWETGAPSADVRFGSLRISAPARGDAWWVVDGQQRLASLARVLLPAAPDEDEFALWFDLDEEKLGRPSREQGADGSRWLPMTEVLDSERLMQWVFRYAKGAEARRGMAFAVGKRIREYEIPAYLVRTDDERILREVLGRINSTGKRLNNEEVFDALHGGRAESRPATLSEIADDLEQLDFGRVDDKLLYRLLRALSGLDVFERTGGPLRLKDPGTTYGRTAAAAARVVQFLKTTAAMPRFELLPYKQPFVLLGRFFSLYPDPDPRSLDLLSRWLWRGALSGAHRGDAVFTRASLEGIGAGDESVAVQRLLSAVDQRPAALPDAAAPFNFRHAAAKLQALALLDLGPRDLETGERLSTARLFDAGAGGAALPAIVAGGSSGLAHSAANRILHPKRAGLVRLVEAVTDPDILASHGIPPAALAALRQGNEEAFWRLRAAMLSAHYEGFFARRARWDEPDRPPIRALLIEEDV
jgi:hypothetical protein